MNVLTIKTSRFLDGWLFKLFGGIAGAHANVCYDFECQDYHPAGRRPNRFGNRTNEAFGKAKSVECNLKNDRCKLAIDKI